MKKLVSMEKTMQNQNLEDLYHLAYTDSLTGTYNRNMLKEVRKELNDMSAYIAIVDIDDLKHINDTYGHDFGDLFIRHIADILKKTSATVFRLGGDEFLLVDVVPIKLEDIIGISYGHIYKPCTIGMDMALHLADEAMYEHKKANQALDRIIEAFKLFV